MSPAPHSFPLDPLLQSIAQWVEAEERVIEAIMTCVEKNDSAGILRSAHELTAIRRASTGDYCVV